MVQMKKSRFQGCLLGLACGDVVGTPVNLLHLERLISVSDGRQQRQACGAFANYLVFG